MNRDFKKLEIAFADFGPRQASRQVVVIPINCFQIYSFFNFIDHNLTILTISMVWRVKALFGDFLGLVYGNLIFIRTKNFF